MPDIEVSTNLFSQAAMLMFVGMSFVFVFLGLLIVVIRFFISPLAKKFPDKAVPTEITSNNQDTTVIAAITAAINTYRKKHK